MRVFLVGTPSDRARLRARLSTAIEVVAEFSTLTEARAAAAHPVAGSTLGEIDGILLPPKRPIGDERDLTGDLDNERELTRDMDNERVPIDMDNERELVVGNESLTPREVQVIELLAEGLSNKAIAARLRISDQTVKFHVASISGKLGAANRTDAVRRAVRRGLITL